VTTYLNRFGKKNEFHFPTSPVYLCAMVQLTVVFGIGLAGGILSGLLGIGGGIITAPLLLYLPALFGQASLSMHVVSGLTITQSLFAGLIGAVAHGRQRSIDRRLAGVMSAAIFGASLAGAAGSKYFSHEFLLGVFAALALVAALLILVRREPTESGSYAFGEFSARRAAAVAGVVGLVGGLVGQGGSFLLIPAVVAFLKVPLRVAMGSNLVIVFFGSLAGFVGKATTGQVPPILALALLAGIIPGSWIGSRLSHRAPVRALRLALGGLIAVAGLRMVWDLVSTCRSLP
jgi:uncharacterized membrane protein YfcA